MSWMRRCRRRRRRRRHHHRCYFKFSDVQDSVHGYFEYYWDWEYWVDNRITKTKSEGLHDIDRNLFVHVQ